MPQGKAMYEVEVDRESIHQLIDRLPEEEWELAHWTLLAHLKRRNPVLWSFMTVHEEYIEPEIEELEEYRIAETKEQLDIEAGWADVEAGNWVYLDDVKGELLEAE